MLHLDNSPTSTGDKVMSSYFQYKEVGKIKGILRNKYNLFSGDAGGGSFKHER
jgi:hypothetical protein